MYYCLPHAGTSRTIESKEVNRESMGLLLLILHLGIPHAAKVLQ